MIGFQQNGTVEISMTAVFVEFAAHAKSGLGGDHTYFLWYN